MPTSTVIRIERVQNASLWQRYTQQLALRGNEKLLWHGTRNT
eukprot:CAMPEP_0198442610 /NCGR_PEP_ID=MMETSP1452-20131203/67243_1 /TAXON_ID=1181717 /ORGANISM="Synchroma pusillum, Strain CCMP3072" /LENGTH=41 /DNA_ID= /DNA_START= /DNA_END= /DNA_ORIENTATION=